MPKLQQIPIIPKLQNADPFANDSNSIPNELPPITNNEPVYTPITPDLRNQLNSFTQPESSFFPQQLDSSGYIILSGVAIFFGIAFILFFVQLQRLVSALKSSTSINKSVTTSLYSQQLIMEYRFLLTELSNSIDPVEKTNARTSLYNFLNKICREICEGLDPYLAQQLLSSFSSKIQARFIKIENLPDGLIYFRIVGKFLVTHSDRSEEELFKMLQGFIRKEIREYKQLNKNTFKGENGSNFANSTTKNKEKKESKARKNK